MGGGGRSPKNEKPTKKAFNVGSTSARRQNAILMAFRWGADDGPLIVLFGTSHKKNVAKVGNPLANFLDPRMTIVHTQKLARLNPCEVSYWHVSHCQQRSAHAQTRFCLRCLHNQGMQKKTKLQTQPQWVCMFIGGFREYAISTKFSC